MHRSIKILFTLIIAVSFFSAQTSADWKEWTVNSIADCNERSNPECLALCKADGFKTGQCAFRDPNREPKIYPEKPKYKTIRGPWGKGGTYGYPKDIPSHCSNPKKMATGPLYVISNYCKKKGFWKNIDFNGKGYPGVLVYGRTNKLSFSLGSTGSKLEIEEIHKDGCNDSNFCVRGMVPKAYSFSFNSPYIYFDGVSDGEYSISISSLFDHYRTTPSMNIKNGWDISIQDSKIITDKKIVENLFYELDVSSINLTRNGINFSGRDSLIGYLESSDFYSQMGMNQREKENSLEYVRTKLEKGSQNYFLTILTDESIQDISTLTILNKKGNTVDVRRSYFAIYPTEIPIKKTGGLIFPNKNNTSVKEFGEMLVQPTMQVFWK